MHSDFAKSDSNLLTRGQAAQALTAAGFPVSRATLAAMAAGRGEGPLFQKFGRRALYRREDLIGWATGRLRAPHRAESARDGR